MAHALLRAVSALVPTLFPEALRMSPFAITLGLVIVVRIVINRAEQIDDPKLLAMSYVFFQRRDQCFLLCLVTTKPLGVFDQSRVDVEVRGLQILFY